MLRMQLAWFFAFIATQVSCLPSKPQHYIGSRHSSILSTSNIRSTTCLRTMKTAVESYNAVVAASTLKCNRSNFKNLLSGFLSGCHIGFGSYLSLTIGGQCHKIAAENPGLRLLIAGSIGFPFATIMTTTAGGDIFTGSIFFASAAWFEKKVQKRQVARYLATTFIGNALGAFCMACLATIAGTLPAAVPITSAMNKTSWTFAMTFTRGLLCSWLICMAAFNAQSGDSFADKAIGTFLPISAFVMLSLENSVSNMFTIPFGMLNGAPISIKKYLLKNLIPVTMGNLVGSLAGVMMPYAFLHSDRSNL